jgi:hypothetical protein
VVEGTPLLREHTPKKCIEGSNPSLSAKIHSNWFQLVRTVSDLFGAFGVLCYSTFRTRLASS